MWRQPTTNNQCLFYYQTDEIGQCAVALPIKRDLVTEALKLIFLPVEGTEFYRLAEHYIAATRDSEYVILMSVPLHEFRSGTQFIAYESPDK